MSADGLMKAISSPFHIEFLTKIKSPTEGIKDAILDELVNEVRDKTVASYEERHRPKPFAKGL